MASDAKATEKKRLLLRELGIDLSSDEDEENEIENV